MGVFSERAHGTCMRCGIDLSPNGGHPDKAVKSALQLQDVETKGSGLVVILGVRLHEMQVCIPLPNKPDLHCGHCLPSRLFES